jgi:hypothetical protein
MERFADMGLEKIDGYLMAIQKLAKQNIKRSIALHVEAVVR